MTYRIEQSSETGNANVNVRRRRRSLPWGLVAPLMLVAPLLIGAKGCDEAIVGDVCPPGEEATCQQGQAGSSSGGGSDDCGGLLGLSCDPGEFCKYSVEAMCGAADQTGVCTPIPSVCTRIYSPVCACDGKTYGNECEAEAASVSVSANGACADPSIPPDPGNGNACGGLQGLSCARGEYCSYPPVALCGAADQTGVCAPIPSACREIYQPVCGCDGITYGNACEAATRGVSVVAEGACADPNEPPQSRACGGLLGLSCVPGEFCSYARDAACGAADQTGVCAPSPEVCADIYQPVCGCDGRTYGNECEANGAGVSAASSGECAGEEPNEPRDCGGLLGLACAADQYCNYPREAQCGAADQTGVCAPIPSACTRELAPVCGCDGTTYSNGCMAASAGVSVISDGDCPAER